MKATHRLSNNYGDEWLLCAKGEEHWCSIREGNGGYGIWHGPNYGTVESTYSDKANFTLVKLNTFKGNK